MAEREGLIRLRLNATSPRWGTAARRPRPNFLRKFVELEHSRATSSFSHKKRVRKDPFCMAEREGFEPSIGVTYTPLAGERLRPLGHLSVGAHCTYNCCRNYSHRKVI